MTIQQVEEEYPFCLVSDRRCERLASDDMPARGFILELLISSELTLNLRCQVLVNLRLVCCLLADYLGNKEEREQEAFVMSLHLLLIALSTSGYGISVNLILWGGRGSICTSLSSESLILLKSTINL